MLKINGRCAFVTPLPVGPGKRHTRGNAANEMPRQSLDEQVTEVTGQPTRWLVSRHPGALAWAKAHTTFDRHVEHLDPDQIQPGDEVMGTLPIHLAAAVCARGARYWHLTLELRPEQRGKELDAADMLAADARLEPFVVMDADVFAQRMEAMRPPATDPAD